MIVRPLVGLLGGTFDPIHLGHTAAAAAAQRALGLDEVRYILSARPPHRADSPHASEYHRIEMIRRAVRDAAPDHHRRVEVSDLEIRRAGPSYTYDTLQTLHAEGLTSVQLVFITGTDAFAEIETWHRYPDVLDHAHFAVIARPSTTLDALRARVPALALRLIAPDQFSAVAKPAIILIDADTPDISSTDIRQRASRGESLDGLVTPSVAAYIAQHALYRTAPGAPVASHTPDAPSSTR